MDFNAPVKRKWIPWFLVVGIIAALQRMFLWLNYYPPGIYHDTEGYRRLSETILGGWQFYDGTRPPGYPLWMALIGTDAQVYLSQLILGLATTLVFFFIGWQVARSPAFGAVAALAHTLNLGQLFFEGDLLSETLTTFWLALVLGCAWLALREGGSGQSWRWVAWLGAGLFAALAGITRSLFLFMPFWVALFLALARVRTRFDWRPLMIASLPGIVIIGLWVNFIYQRYGILSVTTMGGFHLVQHTGQWFELLPQEDALLRDIFLQHRAAQIALTGSPGNTIWDAVPDMMKASGLGFNQLSSKLASLSLMLIWQHPDRYLVSVLDGWQLFWRAPVYWRPDVVANESLRSALQMIVLAERVVLVAANLVFLASSALALFWRRWRSRLGITPWWAFLILTVWLTSVVQTLPDHGDNPRFLVPLQSWIVVWVAWLVWRLVKRQGAT
jgi:hypothetical protein